MPVVLKLHTKYWNPLGQDYVLLVEKFFALIMNVTRSQQDHTDLSW